MLALGYALAWWLFPTAAAERAILVTAVADPMAATVGTRFGGGRRKSWAGSAACAATAVLVLLLTGASRGDRGGGSGRGGGRASGRPGAGPTICSCRWASRRRWGGWRETSGGAMSGDQRLFLIDGYALIYRAFFAMLSRPLTTSRGENTSVAWGITNFLLRLAERHRPEFVAWVHDAGTSFRHERYPEYKATREKLDAELQQDFDQSVRRVEALLRAFRVPLVAVDGYEADDVIATLAGRGAAAGLDVVIVSGDKDFYQLVGPRVSLLNPGRGGPAAVEEQFVTEANAAERLGVPPAQTVDFLALVGDSADNVPGIRGVGEKTAVKLLQQYGTLEAILAHAGDVPQPRLREALERDAERARLSRELVTLHRDVPVRSGHARRFAAQPPDRAALLSLVDGAGVSLAGAHARRARGEAGGARPPRRIGWPIRWRRSTPSSRRARAAGALALDTETTSLDPMRAGLVGLSIAVAPGEAWYLPFAHHPSSDMLERRDVREPAAACGSRARARWSRSCRRPGGGQDRAQHQVRLAGAAPRRGGAGRRHLRHDDRELHDRSGQAVARARHPRAGAVQRPAAALRGPGRQGTQRAELRRGAGERRGGLLLRATATTRCASGSGSPPRSPTTISSACSTTSKCR